MTDTLVSIENELLEKVLIETPVTVLITEDPVSTLITTDTNTFVVETTAATTIVVSQGMLGPSGPQGPVGPPGPQGISEEDKVYSKRTDFADATTIYKAEAAPGTPEASALWRIRKLIIASDDDVTELWAGGTASFDKQWILRTTYTYT